MSEAVHVVSDWPILIGIALADHDRAVRTAQRK